MMGVMCKVVDATKPTQGKRVLRCSNAFAAAYAALVSYLCTDWLFFAIGNGDFAKIRDALVAEDPWLEIDKSLGEAGQSLCIVIFAYMVQDIVQRLLGSHMDVRYFLHHFACLGGLSLVLFYNHHPIYCAALAISEFSTPVVSLFEIAESERGALKRFVEPCGMLLNVLFPIRIAWFNWTFYLFAFEKRGFKPFTFEMIGRDEIGLVCTLILVLINWSWYFTLVRGTLQALGRKKQHNKFMADAPSNSELEPLAEAVTGKEKRN